MAELAPCRSISREVGRSGEKEEAKGSMIWYGMTPFATPQHSVASVFFSWFLFWRHWHFDIVCWGRGLTTRQRRQPGGDCMDGVQAVSCSFRRRLSVESLHQRQCVV